MRTTAAGIVAVARETTFTFDGEIVNAYEGESLAAALTAAGRVGLRRSKGGSPRGVFCGMGVCSECLVAVDGRQNVRACMTAVAAGMRVETQGHPAAVAASAAAPLASPAAGDAPLRPVEVLVVGGGPAGLAAAKAAALAGAEVALVDERGTLGGQYFKQLAKTHAFAREDAADRQFRNGRALIAEIESLGVRINRDAAVWSVFGPREVAVVAGGDTWVFQPSQLILATGAYERAVPVPGWTLPGYLTTGAAQTLLRAHRVAPGRRLLFAGNGPLNLQVAAEMVGAGVEVAAVVEAAPRPGLGTLAAAAAAWRHSPDLMVDGAGLLWRLRRAGVPVLYGSAVVEARGKERVESVTVARLGPAGEALAEGRREFAVDAVCVGHGFMPTNDLSRPLGCRHRWEADKGSLVVERNPDGETTVPGVFVAGDCGGLGGARAAVEQGFIAGCAAAANLGKVLPADLAAERARRRRRLASHQRFQAALWTLFKAPRLTTQLARDDTPVCRCEEVSLGAVRRALASGITSAGGVKRLTRAGMGPCQGRYCGPLIAELVEAATGTPTGEFSYFAPRPPIKPVPIAVLGREKPGRRHAELTTADQTPPEPSAVAGLDIETDVLVVGGGILGCSTAYYLARQGVEVALIDRDDVNTQASGRNAGSLHTQMQSFQAQNQDPAWIKAFDDALPLYLEAARTWKELSGELDCDIEIAFCGGLMAAETENELRFLEKKVRRERPKGLDVHVITGSDLRRIAPYFSEHVIGAEYCPHEGKLNPTLATPALVRGAERAGVRIFRHAELRALERTPDGFEARVSRGRIRCRRLVNAAGPWAHRVAAMVGVEFPMKQVCVHMNVTEPAAPFLGHLLYHADKPLTMKQVANGNLVIGGGWPARVDPASGRPTVLRESIEGSLWLAQHVVPQTAQLRLLRTWAGVNVAIDGKPLLGPVPGLPGFYNAVTATGYTLGPVCGRLISEVMTGQNLSFDIEPFSIERFART